MLTENMYFVYVLESALSGKYYIGQTNNLKDRLNSHNNNKVTSTRNRGPWSIKFTKSLSSRAEAIALEAKLKSWKKRKAVDRWGTANSL